MRINILIAISLMLCVNLHSFAELQTVEVGGNIRIRGNFYNMDSLGDYSMIEQRTKLNVKADFTQDISAFVEFDYYDWWGEDFRSVYFTGADMRAGVNDAALYQGYIEARNLWGTPLQLRVGRQELAWGSQWLMGVNDSSAYFTGLSFDALRLTFSHDLFIVDAVTAKLAENYGDFGNDDIDLYALYFSYIGIENVSLDAYWMFIRDDSALLGDDVDLHTVGLRGAGALGAFDFNVEGAYQFGEVEGQPNPWFNFFDREADVEYDSFGVHAEAGYSFDIAMQPRLYARFVYLDGGNPSRRCRNHDRDLAFNRLFSNVTYSEFLDNHPVLSLSSSLSNVLIYAMGVQASPTEALKLNLAASYFETDEPWSRTYFRFWRRTAAKELGWEVGLYGDYQYSEDLVFRAGYAHFFGGKGLERNNLEANALIPWNGDRDDDYDYLFVESEICF